MAQRSTRLMGKARITELRRSPDKRILAQVYLFKPWKQISRSVLMTRQKLVEALPSRVFSQLISEFEYDENTLVHTAVAKCVGEQELFADPDDSFVIDLLQDILDEGYVHPFSDDDDQLWISANGWYTRSEIARNDGCIEFTVRSV
ncbi:hypothetical protein VNI00_014792 [Paramarasmius palmivorus]|uniref:Uncharacterized protein n=1 Tax=Paramarasmius palmivorus TaxID=297713 RepID=A0AAW0BS37_9AGAR